MSKRTRFPELRAELRAREAHSKTIGKRIRETAGEERMKLWEEKRAHGRLTRFLLLAYAFLRGMPRWVCEPLHHPDAWMLLPYVHEHAKRFVADADPKTLKEWLAAAPVAVPEASPSTFDKIAAELRQMPLVEAARDFEHEPEPFI